MQAWRDGEHHRDVSYTFLTSRCTKFWMIMPMEMAVDGRTGKTYLLDDDDGCGTYRAGKFVGEHRIDSHTRVRWARRWEAGVDTQAGRQPEARTPARDGGPGTPHALYIMIVQQVYLHISGSRYGSTLTFRSGNRSCPLPQVVPITIFQLRTACSVEI